MYAWRGRLCVTLQSLRLASTGAARYDGLHSPLSLSKPSPGRVMMLNVLRGHIRVGSLEATLQYF